MSTKEIVTGLLEDVSLHEVAREIEFIAAVREGGVTTGEARERVSSWGCGQEVL
jgi:hypothetical protein